MRAAWVAVERPSCSCRRASVLCSSRVVYRSWLTTPLSTHLRSGGSGAAAPSITATCRTGGSEGPVMRSMRATTHDPVSPPTKLVRSGTVVRLAFTKDAIGDETIVATHPDHCNHRAQRDRPGWHAVGASPAPCPPPSQAANLLRAPGG